jgi:uncharacterized protein
MRASARALAAACVAIAVALVATAAFAKFNVPPLTDGHVVDTSGQLTQEQIDALNQQMERVRLKSGYVIDALVTGSLEGESIDDVGYETINTWTPGDAKKDNGVVIIVAPNERKDRIEVGKGIEGALTDLQTDDIRRKIIEPRLKAGDIAGGIAAGTQAIAATLMGDDPGQAQRPVGAPVSAARVVFFVILLVIVIWALSRRGGGGGGFFWFGGGGWGGGGGGGGDCGDWGGGGGGGGFGGGGGHGGGGGSSGSY